MPVALPDLWPPPHFSSFYQNVGETSSTVEHVSLLQCDRWCSFSGFLAEMTAVIVAAGSFAIYKVWKVCP